MTYAGARPTQSFALISHLRWIAALLVAIQHIHQNVLASFWQLPHPSIAAKLVYALSGYGHAAVIVFFVISGFLVGGRAYDLLRTPDIRKDWPVFLIDRFSRIFIVLIPALVVAGAALALLLVLRPIEPFVFGADHGYSIPTPLSADLHLSTWLLAIPLLNGFVGPTLNSNAPLWSLAYEWFYYLAALSFVLVYRRVFSTGALTILGYTLLVGVISLISNPEIVLSGFIWLLGAASRLALRRRLLSGAATKYLGLVGVAILVVVERFHIVPGIFWGIGIAFLIAHTSWTEWHFGSKIADRLAGFSYSLYVTHFPVMLASIAVLYATGILPHRLAFSPKALCIAFGILLLSVVIARLFAMFTEDRTKQLRKRILNLVERMREKPRHVALEKSKGSQSA